MAPDLYGLIDVTSTAYGSSGPTTYYIAASNYEREPEPAKASAEPIGRAKRRRWIDWLPWSNQHHAPAYDVFKPVYCEMPKDDQLQAQRQGRSRRARFCSSPVPMMPY